MKQTRIQSALETATSTGIGFAVAWGANIIVLPFYGVRLHASSSFTLTCIFTIISLIRQYTVRRLFNHIHHK